MSDIEDKLSGMSMTTGVVRYSDLGYVLTTDDEMAAERVPHSILLTRDGGQWGTFKCAPRLLCPLHARHIKFILGIVTFWHNSSQKYSIPISYF